MGYMWIVDRIHVRNFWILGGNCACSQSKLSWAGRWEKNDFWENCGLGCFSATNILVRILLERHGIVVESVSLGKKETGPKGSFCWPTPAHVVLLDPFALRADYYWQCCGPRAHCCQPFSLFSVSYSFFYY